MVVYSCDPIWGRSWGRRIVSLRSPWARKLIFKINNNKIEFGAGEKLSGKEHWLLFQIWLPAPTWQLPTFCNTSSKNYPIGLCRYQACIQASKIPSPNKRTNVKTASVLTTEEATPVPNSRPCSSFGLLDRKAQFKLGTDLETQKSWSWFNNKG